jgi:hypothetical protein
MLRKSAKAKKKVVIEVSSKTGETNEESGFDLQDFFDNLYKEKSKAEASAYSVLFSVEDAKSIVSKWEIVYDKSAELLAPRGNKDKRGKGLDGFFINCFTSCSHFDCLQRKRSLRAKMRVGLHVNF